MSDGYAGDVTPAEAWSLLQRGAQLVDVRTQAEWSYVGVPDLTSLGRQPVLVEWVGYPHGRANPQFLEELRAGLAGADPDTPVVFLCRSGVRSIGAARVATDAGYTRSYNVLDGFEGGLDAAGHRGATGWRAAGLPWRQG